MVYVSHECYNGTSSCMPVSVQVPGAPAYAMSSASIAHMIPAESHRVHGLGASSSEKGWVPTVSIPAVLVHQGRPRSGWATCGGRTAAYAEREVFVPAAGRQIARQRCPGLKSSVLFWK
jgi:hypothetical protein